MQTRFTILGLMELTALIGLVIGADRIAFSLLPMTLFFVGAIAIINAMAGAYLGMRLRGNHTLPSTVRSAGISTIGVSLLNSLVVGAIVAEGFRRGTGGEYFSWSRAWFEFLIGVAFVSTVSTV